SRSACLAWWPICWQGHASRRGIAQSGSASGLGPEGRRFKSCCPDQFHHHKNLAAELTASTVLAETGTLDARFDLAPHRACGSRSNNRQAGTKRKPSAASCKSPKVWMTLIASLDRATVTLVTSAALAKDDFSAFHEQAIVTTRNSTLRRWFERIANHSDKRFPILKLHQVRRLALVIALPRN